MPIRQYTDGRPLDMGPNVDQWARGRVFWPTMPQPCLQPPPPTAGAEVTTSSTRINSIYNRLFEMAGEVGPPGPTSGVDFNGAVEWLNVPIAGQIPAHIQPTYRYNETNDMWEIRDRANYLQASVQQLDSTQDPNMKRKNPDKCLHYLVQNWAYRALSNRKIHERPHLGSGLERRRKVWEWICAKQKCKDPKKLKEPHDYSYFKECERWEVITESFVRVRIGNTNYFDRDTNGPDFQTWCTTAATVDGFMCLGSGIYYSRDIFQSVYYHEQRINVEQRWAELNLIQWRDGSWHNCTDPIDRIRRMRETGQIPQYHEYAPAWRDQSHTGTEIKYGIELEIWSPHRRDICSLAEDMDGMGEQDGSLCRDNGLEIITKPLTFKEVADKDGFWRKILEFSKDKCGPWPKQDGYGMHVSLSRAAMKEDHQIRFVCFIHANRRLCEHVAERRAQRWAQFKAKAPNSSALDCDKYEAASVRGEHRIEVRIFKATVDEGVFMRNVEFCAAVAEFTGTAMTDFSTGPFLQWIQNRSHEYPHLFKHLRPFVGKTNVPELQLVDTTEEEDEPGVEIWDETSDSEDDDV